jgi:hypothetical protein
MCSCVKTFLCCVHNELPKALEWRRGGMVGGDGGCTRDSGGGWI